MTRQALDAAADIPLEASSHAEAYLPSFVDRFMNVVEGLPIPFWLTYAALFVGHSLLNSVIGWSDGTLPPSVFLPESFLFPVWLWGPLAIMTYLNRVAVNALSDFQSLLALDDESLERLKHELTIMPARPVIASTFVWVGVYLIFLWVGFEAFATAYGLGLLSRVYFLITGLVTFGGGSSIYYHSFRQLRLVSRTVNQVDRFDLFYLDPVYSFSRLTARTGIGWMILITMSLLALPAFLVSVPFLVLIVIQLSLSVAAFILPLWRVHQRLVREKQRMQSNHNRRARATLERLHRAVDENLLDKADGIRHLLEALASEREVLKRIPTWPWRPQTLTGFLSIVILPVVLMVVQLSLELWLKW